MNPILAFPAAFVALVLLPACAIAIALWLPQRKWRQRFERKLGLLVVYSVVMCIVSLSISKFLMWHLLYDNADSVEEAARPIAGEAGRTFSAINLLWLRTRDAVTDLIEPWLVDIVGTLISLLCGLNAVIAAWRRLKPTESPNLTDTTPLKR